MKEFKVGITIKAENEAMAKRKIIAAVKLINNVKTEDLEKVANKVESNPAIIQTALAYL